MLCYFASVCAIFSSELRSGASLSFISKRRHHHRRLSLRSRTRGLRATQNIRISNLTRKRPKYHLWRGTVDDQHAAISVYNPVVHARSCISTSLTAGKLPTRYPIQILSNCAFSNPPLASVSNWYWITLKISAAHIVLPSPFARANFLPMRFCNVDWSWLLRGLYPVVA